MTLDEKLWKEFSKMVRMKHANEYGWVKCFTCSASGPWKEFDCGHFMPRAYLATRYSILNNKPQCVRCNRMEDGQFARFSANLATKYGAKIPRLIIEIAREGQQLTVEEKEWFLSYCKDQIKLLSAKFI